MGREIDIGGVLIIRYEDLVYSPYEIMNDIYGLLRIPFDEQFGDLVSVIKMTGDSGRKGIIIKTRVRRPLSVHLCEHVEL